MEDGIPSAKGSSTVKVCRTCHEEKPASLFPGNKREKDGIDIYCRSCVSRRNRDLRKKNMLRKDVLVPQTKTCPKCMTQKSGTDFHKNRRENDGLEPHCKTCFLARKRRSAYGVSKEWVADTLATQNGGCAVCKTQTPMGRGGFHVDHNHETGEVRGLLCHKCNMALGLFKDRAEILLKAISFLGTPTSYFVEYKRDLPKTTKETILLSQRWECKICSLDLKKTEKPCLDHDHSTGLVRGYLCNGCNSGLGLLKESASTIRNAISYLKSTGE
jgi:hypothetical protein